MVSQLECPGVIYLLTVIAATHAAHELVHHPISGMAVMYALATQVEVCTRIDVPAHCSSVPVSVQGGLSGGKHVLTRNRALQRMYLGDMYAE